MTTTYTDAQIEVVAAKLDSEFLSEIIPAGKDGAQMLRSLLSERQAAMQGRRGEVDVRDAYRWRHARKILPVEYIEQSQREFESYGLSSSEEENIAADKAIDEAIAQEKQS